MDYVKVVEHAVEAGESSFLSDKALSLSGFSSFKVKHFLNNVCASVADLKYLEIGVMYGSTLLCASFRNKGEFYGIDNFCGFGGPQNEEILKANIEAFKDDCTVSFTTGDCWDQEVKDKTEMFALYEYEKFLHGERYKGTVSQTSNNIGGLGSDTAAVDWVTGGMRWHAEQYATADRFVKVNGTITWDYFLEKVIYPFTERGSNQKGLFIPSIVGQLMDKVMYGKLEILPKDKDMNLDVAVWTIFGGQTVTLFLDRGLNVPPTTGPSNGSIILGLDFAGPNSPAYMQFEKTHVREITLADGTDGKAAEIYNIAGLMAPDFNNHIWVEGITGASAA